MPENRFTFKMPTLPAYHERKRVSTAKLYNFLLFASFCVIFFDNEPKRTCHKKHFCKQHAIFATYKNNQPQIGENNFARFSKNFERFCKCIFQDKTLNLQTKAEEPLKKCECGKKQTPNSVVPNTNNNVLKLDKHK